MHRNQNIIINEFMFCNSHGKETCQECLVDHRLGNNLILEDDLIQSIMSFDWVDRKPIEVYKLGVTPLIPNNPVQSTIHQTQDTTLYQCLNHQTINCSICFNWIQIILNGLYL
ncbi:uncharacterized protein MELLADRAFT_110827 [Melampsora larici-populina 98AG31]|uniref:Uncharacterized protein n=1 Tax=Melampsora larici-populina (strain 98AG31 / pathotype 3-4-7) TaxID=747676 RepID=F4S138_MELLP|nr:uncharacterized protein MELLADRAFT_110827 [Melampsora larici-populina 98AG31]EGG01707.1 hypothetical protein MELLADRAFT_110827 [Melampsora larici-populina 98AG31]